MSTLPSYSRRLALGLALGGLGLTAAGCVKGESSGAAAGSSAGASASGSAGGAGGTVRLDYALYNPLSLVVREQKILENAGLTVQWEQSLGSNKANEFLRNDNLDLASTAGSAVLQARTNGSPVKTVDVYSQPEWTALVVAKDSTVTDVAGLRGKRIAATTGTDPYFFLQQALAEAGLSATDVEITNLQHADGRAALERGDVDAWAGLDPNMAATELQSGSKLLYRNVDFCTYGLLNARESFIESSPELVQQVVDAYATARAWALANPAELATLYAAQAQLTPEVAARVLERTTLDVDSVPGEAQRSVLEGIVPLMASTGDIPSAEAATEALDGLLVADFAEKATPA
ncbi:aliphatic sulfonate ABC transporter substrate-binding protein [Kineococcus radiotolerans]|uniref:Putative aliphatic sulfonates-binding protein n=1 Tax=Kineococcus radiotolerans (strain ATCC BAA-149 / DSM 14245 / SRS30216) TaxID=266940 RepID=A6W540_KINRD|nr:aliphatic sulfonate ABC transporter substrate-binding protein [Kineococcus radiotolerans]ABS01929.1 aliphatic sulfonates family ABC transporter, periplsmic ligand-binding protein [Kineococcus radiotolerans SRS30216 = ATCC BAA-149]